MLAWYSEMTAIPVTASVPVIGPDGAARGVVVEDPVPDTDRILYLRVYVEGRGVLRWHADECRVDLNKGQGFGYALRYYLAQYVSGDGTTRPAIHTKDEVVRRHLLGQTTEADKVLVARALN